MYPLCPSKPALGLTPSTAAAGARKAQAQGRLRQSATAPRAPRRHQRQTMATRASALLGSLKPWTLQQPRARRRTPPRPAAPPSVVKPCHTLACSSLACAARACRMRSQSAAATPGPPAAARRAAPTPMPAPGTPLPRACRRSLRWTCPGHTRRRRRCAWPPARRARGRRPWRALCRPHTSRRAGPLTRARGGPMRTWPEPARRRRMLWVTCASTPARAAARLIRAQSRTLT